MRRFLQLVFLLTLCGKFVCASNGPITLYEGITVRFDSYNQDGSVNVKVHGAVEENAIRSFVAMQACDTFEAQHHVSVKKITLLYPNGQVYLVVGADDA